VVNPGADACLPRDGAHLLGVPRNRPLPLDAIGVGLAIGFGLAVAVGAVAGLPSDDATGRDLPVPGTADWSNDGAGIDGAGIDGAGIRGVDVHGDHLRVDDPERRTPVVRAVEAVAPAVVSITCEVQTTDPFGFFRGRTTPQASEGSGVVIEADGVVLTNAHVVNRAQRILATFADGTAYPADIIGVAPELDLAVLRLRGATDLVTVPRASSGDLMLGEPVIAIGNPFGLGHTVTTGVVSAVSRSLETDDRVYQDFIQTDASINPGNSGGPLLDARGRLVGINAAIRPNAQGIGFAIPADRALTVARDLVDFGQVRIAWLGLDVEEVRIARGGRRAAALRVHRVHPGGPASTQGVEEGDFLVSVDSRSVQGRADLNAYLASVEPGEAVALTLHRDDRPIQATLPTGAVPDSVIDSSLRDILGVQLAAEPRRDGVPIAGVSPNGAFARVGLRAGDALVAVNGAATSTPGALRDAMRHAKAGHRSAATFTIRRGEAIARIALPI
jgi:serine protease Do